MPETFFSKLEPKTRLLVGAAVLIAIILIIVAIEQPFQPSGPAPVEGFDLKNEPVLPGVEIGQNIGDQAPDFVLFTPDGEAIQLSQFRGEKAVFLNFWASWCPFCLDEMPDMQLVFEEKQGELVVLAVNRGESRERAIEYYEEVIPQQLNGIELTYPSVLDSDESVSKVYILRGMPVSYFIDKNGIIVDRKFAVLTSEEMEQKVQAAINSA